jgi:hypothetical protein
LSGVGVTARKGYVMKKLLGVSALVLATLGLVQCGSFRGQSEETTATVKGALTGPKTFTIPLPPQTTMQSVAAGANDTLLLGDRTVIKTPSGAFATIANLGSAQTNLGADTRVGNVWSVGKVVLRDRAKVAGFVRSQGAVTVPPTASVVPGPIVASTAFTPLNSTSWTVTFPSPTGGNVLLQPQAKRTIQPGSYGAVTVQPNATLTLVAGTYFFQSMDFESSAKVTLDDKNGPISVYVANSVVYRGTVTETANDPARILIGFAGTANVAIEASFIGTFVAPSARVTVGSMTHRGAFFSKGLEFYAGATLITQGVGGVPTVSLSPKGPVGPGVPVDISVRTPPPYFAFPLTYVWTVTTTPPGLQYHLDQFGDRGNFYGIDPGDYTLTITATDTNGKKTSTTTTFHVLSLPMPNDRPDVLDDSAAIVQRPCRGGDEPLADFAKRCDKAMGGVTVPQFDCDAMTATEPKGQGDGTKVQCEAPNVLNSECDRGSHFQMLHRDAGGDGIYIAAHCRHRVDQDHNPDGKYSDVAVIQYNAHTGATCYYQALKTGLDHVAPAPTGGEAGYWLPPSTTAGIRCVHCHDSGPFIRSPYLAQLGQVWPYRNDPNHSVPAADPNYLPGTLTGDLFGPWNKTMPYSFVGLNFQSWEAYSLTNDTDTSCLTCHRMGISRATGSWLAEGTSKELGIRATNKDQHSTLEDDKDLPVTKLPHGYYVADTTSPVWMLPGDIKPENSPTTAVSASSIKACAEAITNGTTLPTGCDATRFASGDTCPPPLVVINGATKSDDHTWENHGKTPLGQPGGRPGFYYFTTIHGPFYQNSAWDPYINVPPAATDTPWDPSTGAPSFLGTYLRIYVEPSGQWMLAWGLNATDLQNPANDPPPPGSPGGVIEGVAFEQIDSIPTPGSCGSNYYTIADQLGTTSPTTVTIDATAGASAVPLTGFIGNVSRGQVFDGEGLYVSSYLSVFDQAGSTILYQQHDTELTTPQWFRAESWGNSCTGWQANAHYAARQDTFSDVALVGIADVANVFCYIDGIGGDWNHTVPDGQGGSIQPYAQIYIDPSSGYHLKVSPSTGGDPNRIWASASCLYLK